MLSVAKLATPLTAATVVVPASVPPAGLVPPSATVTLPEKLGTVFPAASCAATCTAGVSVVPAVVFAGWTVKIGRASCRERVQIGVLVAPVSHVDVAADGKPAPREVMEVATMGGTT